MTDSDKNNDFSQVDDCPHRTTVCKWHRKFQERNFSLKDVEKTGRPLKENVTVKTENVTVVRKILTGQESYITPD